MSTPTADELDKYASPADLAEVWGVTVKQILRWRLEHGWPSLKVGSTIRFKPEHVAEIEAQHFSKPERADGDVDQLLDEFKPTPGSARRKRAS